MAMLGSLLEVVGTHCSLHLPSYPFRGMDWEDLALLYTVPVCSDSWMDCMSLLD